MIINVYMVVGLCFLGRVVNDYLNMLFLLTTIVMIVRILFPTLAPEPLFHTVTVLPGHSLLTDSTQPDACELVTGTNKCKNYDSLHCCTWKYLVRKSGSKHLWFSKN